MQAEVQVPAPASDVNMEIETELDIKPTNLASVDPLTLFKDCVSRVQSTCQIKWW
jgi:hypothetical protein